ncbi:MAG TPA: alpha/beta fold hydrolase [Alphaproteobacteria bacterium]|nr:alpha/beta fold hydrolase [Alphaproteobacteria bacterium]
MKPSFRQDVSSGRFWVARRAILAGLATYLALSILAGIFIADMSLKLRRLPLRHQQAIAAAVRDDFQAALQDVSIRASDGVVLKGWYVHPRVYNGNTVVLLHGITDNREGVAGYGQLLLEHGYAVLLPDARRHGESGGDLATYGVKEADDIHRWVSWVYQHDPPQCVYGLGESYGAALLLQSLAVENRFCAVAAESTFSTAREMSFERVSGPLHLPSWVGRTLGRPAIWSAVVYAHLRYGLDLLQPSPLEAVRSSKVPVLLIHGEADRSIAAWHSQRIANAAPDHVELWLVPHAGHTMAWAAAHQEFESRLLGWFESHPHSLQYHATKVQPRPLSDSD